MSIKYTQLHRLKYSGGLVRDNSNMNDRLAYYKVRPTQSLPHRPGPIQCVRNCANCIIKPNIDADIDAEELIAIKSFEDLVHRKALWWSKFQTIQYHPGQMDILKRALESSPTASTFYVAAATAAEDLEFLRMALDYEKVPEVEHLDDRPSWVELCEVIRPVLLPIKMSSCFVKAIKHQDDRLLGITGLRDLLEHIVERTLEDSTFEVNIVPVVISKDHDEKNFWGLGSICIQILEPYSLQAYLSNLKTKFKTGHLVHHLYYDLARNAPRLPCHLVALVLYNADHVMTKQELIYYVDWLRRASMELNLQIAFTGSSEKAIEFALMVLKDYVRLHSGDRIQVTNYAALRDYAHPIMPNIAYYGIISRAILMLYNRDERNTFQVRFEKSNRVRVMRDDVIELSQLLAESIDEKIPCRRPCATVETCILDTFSAMQTFGKYFLVEEPRISRPKPSFTWVDYDSDEEYFLSKRDDPAFKSWVILTQKQNKLDRLNLFLNAILAYLSPPFNFIFNSGQ